jgi:site-specific recombinase XerD
MENPESVPEQSKKRKSSSVRHTCVTLLLNAGVPVLTVQIILGHKHVDATLAYDLGR